jgi:5'-nucleotidase
VKRPCRRPRILVVNDDGLPGAGLLPLIAVLSGLGEVVAVVPEGERSAVSHCLTLRHPLRMREVRAGLYAVDGTPADCARLGLLEVLKGRADLVVSGINDGYNLGSDVVYSGTVAGALEGVLLGAPALSVSRGRSRRSRDFIPAAEAAGKVAARILARGLPPGVCLNVNVPALPKARLKGFRTARLGRRLYSKKVEVRRDPNGKRYFWLSGPYVSSVLEPGTDVRAVADGFVSVTPLNIDHTYLPMMDELRTWSF